MWLDIRNIPHRKPRIKPREFGEITILNYNLGLINITLVVKELNPNTMNLD